jgi:hypothetical protein
MQAASRASGGVQHPIYDPVGACSTVGVLGMVIERDLEDLHTGTSGWGSPCFPLSFGAPNYSD